MADLAGPLAQRGLVKICGVTDEAAFAATVAAGADLIGLVFVEGSPRALHPEAAGRIAQQDRGGAALVGLFVDPALSEVEEVLEAVPLDMIQLHGRETDADVARVGAAFGLPVVKAAGVAKPGDLYRAAGCPAELMLYDAAPPGGAVVPGGHGVAFDWSVLRCAAQSPPWLLAGGLHPGNVGGAIAACRDLPGFVGVDVSSGVEASRGVKDAGKVAGFVRAARSAMGTATKEAAHG